MFRFIITRVAQVIPTFFGITLVAFAFIRLLPGDPVTLLAGERGVTPERHAELMQQLGYDKPAWQQYFFYLADVVQGDLGKSVVTRQPVLQEFFILFPATLELSICAILFALILGLPAGIIAAVRRGSAYDHTLMGVALTGYSMPIFWWALILIIIFSTGLGWTPVSGRIDLLYFFDTPTGFIDRKSVV